MKTNEWIALWLLLAVSAVPIIVLIIAPLRKRFLAWLYKPSPHNEATFITTYSRKDKVIIFIISSTLILLISALAYVYLKGIISTKLYGSIILSALLAMIIPLVIITAFFPSLRGYRIGEKRKIPIDSPEFTPRPNQRDTVKHKIFGIIFAFTYIVLSIIIEMEIFSESIEKYFTEGVCIHYGIFSRTELILYIILAPIWVISIQTISSYIKGLTAGQYPPPNFKSISPKRYYYGVEAKLKSILMIVFTLIMLIFSIYAAFKAHHFFTEIFTPQVCSKLQAETKKPKLQKPKF